jgi:DNA-binding CsgD family transcriptional regulator
MGHHRTTTDEADEAIHTIDPAVEQLIRRLVENDFRPDQADEADEVILDVEVGGSRYLVVRCARRMGPNPPGASGPAPVVMRSERGPALSPREYEIARMVAKGYANKTIASLLDISSWTVSSHLRRIFSKLDVSSRAAMVARLLDDGSSRVSPSSSLPDQPRPTRAAPDVDASGRSRQDEHDAPAHALAGSGPRTSLDTTGRLPSRTS